jgi:hypothetical protein
MNQIKTTLLLMRIYITTMLQKNWHIEISLLANIYHSHHGWMIYTVVFKVTRPIEGVAK